MRSLFATIALATSKTAANEIRRTLNVSGVKATVTEEIDGSYGVSVLPWDAVKALRTIQALSNDGNEEALSA